MFDVRHNCYSFSKIYAHATKINIRIIIIGMKYATFGRIFAIKQEFA